MAFITDGTTLCRDMWPAGIGRISEETEKRESLPVWRLLPSTYEQLCSRLMIQGMASDRPRVLAVHPAQPTRMELCIRLVGIVGNSALSVRGDWKGDVASAVKATQSLSLINFGCRPAFSHQRNTLANMGELIMAMLNQKGGGRVVEKGAIVLKRRAFTKVKENVAAITLTDADDSSGEVRAMSKHWVVDHRITTAALDKPGCLSVISPYAIRRGDLVDVSVMVEVVNMRGRRGRKTEVMFCPRDVIRLKSAREAAFSDANEVESGDHEELAILGTEIYTHDQGMAT